MIDLPVAVPVTPDGNAARALLLDELAKGPYQAARPTLVDLAAQAFLTWFQGLFSGRGSAAPPVLLTIALVVVVVVLVVALLLFGVPRVNRRSSGTGALFGGDDVRSAADLRRAAAAALAAGDFDTALLERFRALARGLDERTLVSVFPGTTASGFAVRAGGVFEAERDGLARTAGVFDAVRYAGRPATRTEAESVAALDDRLAAARPRLQPIPA